MDFDKSKILTCVTADQAKVGQKGWFSSNIDNLAYLVREEQPKELLGVDAYNAVYAFKTSFQNHALFYPLFYPAPEPTYAERQSEWIKENNVKVGTKVRFTKGFNKAEDGSVCCEHRDAKGVEGYIKTIENKWLFVSVLGGGWLAPFTALEVINEPAYRPFKNAEEFKPYRDKWCIDKLKGRFKIDWHSDTHIYEYGNSFITWEEAFRKYKFEDGTSFGVEVEEYSNN